MKEIFRLKDKGLISLDDLLGLLKINSSKKDDNISIDNHSWVILSKKTASILNDTLSKGYHDEKLGEIMFSFRYAKEIPGSKKDNFITLTDKIEVGTAKILSEINLHIEGQKIASFGTIAANEEILWANIGEDGEVLDYDADEGSKKIVERDSPQFVKIKENEKIAGKTYIKEVQTKTMETYVYVIKNSGDMVEDFVLGGTYVEKMSDFCTIKKEDIDYILLEHFKKDVD